MTKFTPCETMRFMHFHSPYIYTIVEINNETLKCQWENIDDCEMGYCEMNVDYVEKWTDLTILAWQPNKKR
jgi:hypothetical protein